MSYSKITKTVDTKNNMVVVRFSEEHFQFLKCFSGHWGWISLADLTKHDSTEAPWVCLRKRAGSRREALEKMLESVGCVYTTDGFNNLRDIPEVVDSKKYSTVSPSLRVGLRQR